MLLSGLKPVLTHTVKAGIAEGKLIQPVDFALTSENVWKHLRTNVQTAGAIMAFRIKREEIDALLREVFTDLKVEVKDGTGQTQLRDNRTGDITGPEQNTPTP